MKYALLLTVLLSFSLLCLAADFQQPGGFQKAKFEPKHQNYRATTRDSVSFDYQFITPPTTILSSYWDYMIGGYSSLPIRVRPAASGGGLSITYMGQRTQTGLRRVFYAYMDPNNELVVNNEITSTQIKEGFVSQDLDPDTGKPLFAWHANSDPDGEFENLFSWDSFLDGIPGLLTPPFMVLNNPVSLHGFNDNDFDWPIVNIGPSPLPNHRRVFVSMTNSVSHCLEASASENLYIAYADFTSEQLENGETLTWTYTHVPVLDDWNGDSGAWRRFFGSSMIGNDGSFYLIGYHVTKLAGNIYPTEPNLDVFVSTNYGTDPFVRYSIDPSQFVENPVMPATGLGYFTDDSDVPYDSLYMSIIDSNHTNAFMDEDGIIHAPMMASVVTPEKTFLLSFQYMKETLFNPATHQFVIHDVYPQDTNPNDGILSVPWNLDGNGPQWGGTTAADQYLKADTVYPFVYWDDTALDDAMEFHYGLYRITKMNADGKMAMVWHDSQRARLYNKYPADYPELAPFATVPETYISIYPVMTDNGYAWSYPISLNSVETPEFVEGTNPMIPEWVYPADVIEPMGYDNEGNYLGKLHLLFFDDNTWGAASNDEPLGQPNGGRVMYAALQLKFPAVPDANDHPVAHAAMHMLKQNYPNPFNPVTKIAYDLPSAGEVTIAVYNIKGQLVKTLLHDKVSAGQHTLEWNGTDNVNANVGSGVYFYKLTNGSHSETKKMMLIK